jgi:hypothetical protein
MNVPFLFPEIDVYVKGAMGIRAIKNDVRDIVESQDGLRPAIRLTQLISRFLEFARRNLPIDMEHTGVNGKHNNHGFTMRLGQINRF